jgi:hypothetical protein
MNLDAVKRVAIAAAYHGAEILKSNFGRVSNVKKKAPMTWSPRQISNRKRR